MSDVMPANSTPLLKCQGPADCGWTRHRFIRSHRSLAAVNAIRQIFSCGTCASERVFGLVDVNAAGRDLGGVH